MKLLATATALCLVSAAALANEPTEKDAIAMAERGAAMVKAKGKEEVMKRISAKDPDFVQGSLYIDMRDVKTGIVLAQRQEVPPRDHRAGRRQGQGLGRLPVQEPDQRQDRAEDDLHPPGRRCGARSRPV